MASYANTNGHAHADGLLPCLLRRPVGGQPRRNTAQSKGKLRMYPSRLDITEVGTRDGLQSEKMFVPTSRKIDFIKGFAAAGLRRIEATSFVSPRAVPQL